MSNVQLNISASSRAAIIASLLALISMIATAQPSTSEADRSKPISIWINSYYGRNNSGVGLAGRYHWFGLGMTTFGFAGDTSSTLGPRPGGLLFTADIYIVIDLSRWLDIYGNLGFAGRFYTYNDQAKIKPNFEEPDPASLGGGLQVTVSSHIVFGAGFNTILATKYSDDNQHKYHPIASVVGQLGWRF